MKDCGKHTNTYTDIILAFWEFYVNEIIYLVFSSFILLNWFSPIARIILNYKNDCV